ncbi:MAG: UDP-N-acetylglucosamine 4,6-dehydratase (inverting) [Gammaproteobacteria bacterium]
MSVGDQGFEIFDGKSVLITGGTGSFGRAFADRLLRDSSATRIVIFSRDELKQFEMSDAYNGESRLRFFLGDVRDRDRLYRAFDGVDIVVHAAALKQIPAAEYNPFEFVSTNILGAQNIIDAAIDRRVQKVIGLSTDKASSPVNLYGATKLVSDKLFVAGNSYSGAKDTQFAVVRYGNVVGSRGSVTERLRELTNGDTFYLTDERMTRFWITIDQATFFVARSVATMTGGEIFVPKLPSMKLMDIVTAIAPDAKIERVGLRPGEKLHEEMISVDDSHRTIDRGDHYVICPSIDWEGQREIDGERVARDFEYSSDTNADWLDENSLAELLNG